MHDGKKVLECLRKAGKVATECLDPGVQAQLIVELINAYVHFFHHGNQLVSLRNLFFGSFIFKLNILTILY